jgi:hypothetical protein
MDITPGTIYYRTTGGALVEHSGTPAPELPEGCELIDPKDYFDYVKAEEEREHAARTAEAEQAAQQAALVNEALAFYLAAQRAGAAPAAQ